MIAGDGRNRTEPRNRVSNSRNFRLMRTTAEHSVTRITRQRRLSKRMTSPTRSRNGRWNGRQIRPNNSGWLESLRTDFRCFTGVLFPPPAPRCAIRFLSPEAEFSIVVFIIFFLPCCALSDSRPSQNKPAGTCGQRE